MIGQTISHYKITAKLGEGGMGEVYLAQDTKLDRQVALKFVPESLSRDPEARERLLREAKSASKISHPNILHVYSVEEAGGRDFIVMEYVDGVTLDDFIEQERPRMEEVLGVAVGIALGLAKAHQAGVVHRDLKPSNVMIDSDHRARIFDFGLAKLPGASKLTKTGSTLGTFAYMSPEQGRGDEADYRSDIFSFGVILYEMIAGRLPFEGEHEAAILYSTANEEPEPLARFKSDVPDEVQRIVSKCLAKRGKDRYQSAADLVTDLKQIRRSIISGSRVSTLSAPPPKPKRSKLIISATAVAVIALILFVVKPWRISILPTQDASAVENRLAVMYFDNIAEPSDPDRLGEIATTLLITDLSESQYVQVVSSQRLLDILGLLGHPDERQVDHAIATEVAKKAKARWMLLGSILKSKPNLILAAQLIDVASGNAIASQRIDGNEGEDIFALVDRLTVEVKGDLALPTAATTESDPSIAEGTTHSTKAYRNYLEGIEAMDKFYWSDAERSFRKAIEIDSTFAMAYYWLVFQDLGTRPEREHWIELALRYSESLPRKDRWYIEAEAAASSGNIPGEQAALEKIVAAYPDEKYAYFKLAYVHRDAGRSDEAIASLERVIEIDPRFKLAYNLEAYVYNFMGKFDESITAINKYIDLAPGEANPLDSRGDLYAYNGRLKEAAASYRAALAAKPTFYPSLLKLGGMSLMMEEYERADSCFSLLTTCDSPSMRCGGRGALGIAQAYQGRFTQALEILNDGLAVDKMEKSTFMETASKMFAKTDILRSQKKFDEAIKTAYENDAYLRRIRPEIPGGNLATIAVIEDERGHSASADSILEALREEIIDADSTRLTQYWDVRGQIENHRGDFNDALRSLQHISDYRRNFWTRRNLAVAYLGLSEPAEAVTQLENIVGMFDDDASVDVMVSVGSYYLLGKAYEESGWTNRAIEKYQQFLSRWGDGDPGLPYVDDAKARLARLQAQS
jgi:serine/threonine protein kinase/tetratricopeptide (TPR) repeat protein